MTTHFKKRKAVEEDIVPDIKTDVFLNRLADMQDSQADCSLNVLRKDESELTRLIELEEAMEEFTPGEVEYQHALEEAEVSSPEKLRKKKGVLQQRIDKTLAKMAVATAQESQTQSGEENTSDIAAKVVECKYCETKFRYAHGLKAHVKKYHQVKSIDETTEDNIHYVQITKGVNIVFICQYCDRRFKHEGFIQQHIRKIHPGKMVGQEIRQNDCDICGQTFSKVVKLRQHKRYVHNNTTRYTCNICDKLFKMKFNLKKHIKVFHPDFESIDHVWSIKELHGDTDDTENCKTEIKVFRSNEPEINIINIKDNTSKKNPVKCQICNKLLSEKSGLKRHMEEVHSVAVTKRPKPLKCWVKDCYAAFDTLHRLRLHLMNAEDAGGHNWYIEEEENVFDNFEEFSQWKEDVEENENLRYISLNSPTKREDGSYKRVYHCSRSGKYSNSGTGKRRIKIQTQGTSKIGHFCPSSMNVHCNSLGIVTCTYFKTHHGHDTSASAIMHIPIHKRDKQFIAEKVRCGVEPKKILDDLHKKGGRSAFIKLKDIKNHIMLQGITEPHLLGQENYEICVPNIEILEKVEVVEHEYNYEHEYSYEIGEPDSLIPVKNDRDKMLSETEAILSQLSSTFAKQSGNSIDCIKAVTHQIKVIDNAVHIYQVDSRGEQSSMPVIPN